MGYVVHRIFTLCAPYYETKVDIKGDHEFAVEIRLVKKKSLTS